MTPHIIRSVREEIQRWIQLETKSKLLSDAVRHIESAVQHELSNLERSLIERHYIQVILNLWLESSLENIFTYLENDTTIDISEKVSIVLKQLHPLQSLTDIQLLEESSQLKNCQSRVYLELILSQKCFSDMTLSSSNFVSSHFNHFKKLCTDRVLSLCKQEVAKDKINAEKQFIFIFKFEDFLSTVNIDVRRKEIGRLDEFLEHVNSIKDDAIKHKTGQELVEYLIKIFNDYLFEHSNEGRTTTIDKLMDSFNSLKESVSLLGDQGWTPVLQSLVKEIVNRTLQPIATFESRTEGGKNIVVVKGMSIFVSQIREEMQKRKIEMEAQEIQIVGLSCVHIDSELNMEDWHGMNIVIVTDKLFVDKTLLWDLSGHNGSNVQLNATSGHPGESGGNVYVISHERFNENLWTIKCDGGHGSDGKNWTKDEFDEIFISKLSLVRSDKQKMKTEMEKFLTKWDEIVPKANRKYQEIIESKDYENFSIGGIAYNGTGVKISCCIKKTCFFFNPRRHTIVLSKGGKGGQGGYGGFVQFENLRVTNLKINVSNASQGIDEEMTPTMNVLKGSGGTNGKAAGDVGFIYKFGSRPATEFTSDIQGHYIGFDRRDEKLLIGFSDRKYKDKFCVSSAEKLKPRKGWDYATIETSSLEKRGQLEAAKKKVITRQSLNTHVTQIGERQRFSEILQMMFLSPIDHEQEYHHNTGVLMSQIETEQKILHQLSALQHFHLQENRIIRQRYVRSSFPVSSQVIDSNDSTSGSRHNKQKPILSRRFVTDDGKCLDLLPTEGGTDNILHCLFGELDRLIGSYVCKNPKIHRQFLSKELLKNNKYLPLSLMRFFVHRMNKEEDKTDYPIACKMNEEHLKGKDKVIIDAWDPMACGESSELLKKEFAKFIECPLNKLDGLDELQVLANVHGTTIHVYEEQQESSLFKLKQVLKGINLLDGHHQHFIHYNKDCKLWKRLEIVPNLQPFCNEMMVEKPSQSIELLLKGMQLSNNIEIQNAIETLLSWLKTNYPSLKLEECILKIPSKSRVFNQVAGLLLSRFSQTGIGKLSATDISFLIQRMVDYNERNVSPLIYLYIVEKYDLSDWKLEFLLIEIEEKFDNDVFSKLIIQLPYERDKLRKCLRKLNSKTFGPVWDRVHSADSSTFVPEKLEETFKILGAKEVTEIDLQRLSRLPLNDWLSELKSNVWDTEIKELLKNKALKTKMTTNDDEQHRKIIREFVFLLMKLENQKGNTFCRDLLNKLKSMPDLHWSKLKDKLIQSQNDGGDDASMNNAADRELALGNIISIMNKDRVNKFEMNKKQIKANYAKSEDRKKEEIKNNEKTNEKMISNLKKIENLVFKSINMSSSIGSAFNTVGDVKKWSRKIKMNVCNKKKNGTILKSLISFDEFLSVFDRAVHLIFTTDASKPVHLWNTQKVAIVTMLSMLDQTLVQVPTGGGKSLIVAAVAIFHALSDLKVDIITSSSLLAIRDSTLSSCDGGLRDLYAAFDIDVANICSETENDRIKAYNSTVIYGELSSFQRDYLLDKFYKRNIRGDRKFDCIVVDEVDCMLLDRGNTVLYLSHDIPGMESLESLYVFIWEKIVDSPSRELLNDIKSSVFYDLYGQITKDDLWSSVVQATATGADDQQQMMLMEQIWSDLIQNQVIDQYGRLKVENANEITVKIGDRVAKGSIQHRLVYFFRKVTERQRRIRIPSHLLPFVDRHIDTWLENALLAFELEPDEDYVVDHDRMDSNPDLNPRIIIIDPDTGTDLPSSEWGGSLHQFLQLKEGCQLTLQSLKSVFISNTKYTKNYTRMTGVSGTLGTGPEREFLQDTFFCYAQFAIPRAFPNRFIVKPALVFKTKEAWLQAITRDTLETVKSRSIIIFCRSIKLVKMVSRHLGEALQETISGISGRIHRYTRNYEAFTFESQNGLGVGHVIVTTNLAGRGTDIKIDDELRQNGGLHICLTHFPRNARVEEQAMGRAGRKGEPGSGILILCEEEKTLFQHEGDGVEWGPAKLFSMKEDRKWKEFFRVSRLREEFKSATYEEEQRFYQFSEAYNELKKKNNGLPEEYLTAICDSALDKWTLLLDSVDWSTAKKKIHLSQFGEFERTLKLPIDTTAQKVAEWITPARCVDVAKKLLANGGQSNLSNAAIFLNKLLNDQNESQIYPGAHYYRAFLDIKKFKENQSTEETRNELLLKTELIQSLRRAETNIYKHIEMQLWLFYTISSRKLRSTGREKSLCTTDAYRQQKENHIKLLEHYLASIYSLSGKHPLSASQLKINDNIDENKAEQYFQKLVDSKCIAMCQVNDKDTVPDYATVIHRLAENYSVSRLDLEKFLNDQHKQCELTEREMEKKLQATHLIKSTRKSFWKTLIDARALVDAEDCIVIYESDAIQEKHTNAGLINLSEQLTIDFDQPTDGYVVYNPIHSIAGQINAEKGKMIGFSKDYLKRRLSLNEYHRWKKTYESNKVAKLNPTKLTDVDLIKTFGKFEKKLLGDVHIHRQEWQMIWDELKEQEIINDDGSLSLQYKGQVFRWIEGDIYEAPVNSLIERTFAAEIVRRKWLNWKEDPPNHLKAIAALPLKPYRSLLGDLHTTHVVSGANRLTDNTDLNLEQVVKQITMDKEERCDIVASLQRHRPAYTTDIPSELFSLEHIGPSLFLRNDVDNIDAELCLFSLAGFDHVIKIKGEKMSLSLIAKASCVITLGACQMAVEPLIKFFIPVVPLFGLNPGSMAFNDIHYAISSLKSHRNFSWGDYGRQKLQSMEKSVSLIAILKLLKFKKVNMNREEIRQPGETRAVDIQHDLRPNSRNEMMNHDRRQSSSTSASSASHHLDQLLFIAEKIAQVARNRVELDCRLFKDKMINKINNIIVKKLASNQETLNRFWHGNKETNRCFIAERIDKLVTDLSKRVRGYLLEVTGVVSVMLKKTLLSKVTERTFTLLKTANQQVMKTIQQVLDCYNLMFPILSFTDLLIDAFQSELNEFSVTNWELNSSEEELTRFQQEVENDLKIAIATNIDQITEWWEEQMKENVSNHVASMVEAVL